MDQLDSVCPIFLDGPGLRLSQEGSGVLIEFRDSTFLLTAAHVIDHLEQGKHLLIPNSDNEIRPIEGCYSYLHASVRQQDLLDYGYFRLDKDFACSLSEQFYFVREQEFGIKSSYSISDVFSFAGYPFRKANVAGDFAKTEFYAYGAIHVDSEQYDRLGCRRDANIVAGFDRNKSFSPDANRIELPVLPHGISGGGVFLWPQAIPMDRRLVGIAHQWEKEGYFIATRLEIFLEAILRNNPSLRGYGPSSQA